MSDDKVERLENGKQSLRDMGILKPKSGGGEDIADEDKRDVARFLNRILALDLGRQNALFDGFYDTFNGLVASSKEKGTFDDGATDIKGEKIELGAKPQVVHTDKLTGAHTTHYSVNVTEKIEPITVAKIRAYQKKEGGQFYKQVRSGNIVFARAPVTRTDAETGRISKSFPITKPHDWHSGYLAGTELDDRFRPVTDIEGEEWWNEKLKTSPTTRTNEMHIISGAILPIWNKLKQSEAERLRIVRVMTDQGQRIAGVEVPDDSVGRVLKSLGAHKKHENSPEGVFNQVLNDNSEVKLSDGLLIRPTMLQGEDAIEVRVPRAYLFDKMRELGLHHEKINWKDRFFIPTDPKEGLQVMTRLLEEFPAEEEAEESEGEAE